MTEHKKHLYMTVFPNNALIASQLEPDQFGEHYTTGSAKHFSQKVIFAEIDINFRNPYFEIDKYLAETVEHPDGQPKKTKFISSYNVLENVPLSAIQKLYLVTTNGKVLPLGPSPDTHHHDPRKIRIYQEICPLDTLVVSNIDHKEFGKLITTQKAKGAPKILFTQIDFDVDHFLESNKAGQIPHIDLPAVNPSRFFECISELRDHPEKVTKTISLGGILRDISYKFLKHGFWFACYDEIKFFPMPSVEELENNYFYWWKFVR